MLDAMKAKRKYPGTLTVVGLDPGLANLGLGAVRETGKDVAHLGSTLVRTDSRTDQAERLGTIYTEMSDFLKRYHPDVLAIEGQYFHRQRDVAFKVGQALGVCLLAAQQQGVPTVEYGPMQVKQALSRHRPGEQGPGELHGSRHVRSHPDPGKSSRGRRAGVGADTPERPATSVIGLGDLLDLLVRFLLSFLVLLGGLLTLSTPSILLSFGFTGRRFSLEPWTFSPA